MGVVDFVIPILLLFVLVGFLVAIAGTTLQYWRDSIVHPLIVVNALTLYFVVIPGGYLSLTAAYRHDFSDPHGMLLRALAISLVAYLLTIATFTRLDFSSIHDYIPSNSRDSVPPQLLFRIGLFGFLLGVLIYLYYVLINGGFVRLLTVTPRTTFQTVPNTARFKALTLLGTFGGLLTVLTAFTAWNSPDQHQSPPHRGLEKWRLSLVGILVAATLLISVSFRSRFLILIPSAYLLIHFYSARFIRTRHLFGLGGFVVVVGIIFTFLEHLLIGRASLDMVIEAAIHTNRLELLALIIDRVPDSYPYLWGETFLRAVWLTNENLHLYGDYIDVLATGDDTVGVTRSGMFLGELYVNFGLVGTLVGGVLYGALLKFAYRLRESPNYLIRGAYPAAVVSAAFLLPTNAAWALKSLYFRFFPPLALAVVTVYLYCQLTEDRHPIEQRDWP